MSMPPDPFQMGAFQPVSPPHVPSNANYDAYLRQRHNSPQPFLGAVYDDHQTKSIDQVRASSHVPNDLGTNSIIRL